MATLFFSYAHEDEPLRDELEKHLAMLKRDGTINAWHDRGIAAGDKFDGAIDDKLETAEVILLLVSPDFLASRYCFDVEVRRAMQRNDDGSARVIPVILRPCDWHSAPFAKLLAVPRDGKAVTTWENHDEAFWDVVRQIRATLSHNSDSHSQIPGPSVPVHDKSNPFRSTDWMKEIHSTVPERQASRDKPAGQDAVGMPEKVPLNSPGWNPFDVLKYTITMVPAMKYALAVLSLVAIVAIITSWQVDYSVAALGSVVLLILMVVVFVFAKLTRIASKHFITPALLLMWAFVLLTIATGLTLFTAAAFQVPTPLYELIFLSHHQHVAPAIPTVSDTDHTHARLACKIIKATKFGSVQISITTAGGETILAWADPPDYETKFSVAPHASLQLSASGKAIKSESFSGVKTPDSGQELWYALELKSSDSTEAGRCYPVKSYGELHLDDPNPTGAVAVATEAQPIVNLSALPSDDLFYRIVLLTSSFEVGSTDPDQCASYVYGNFDGQGISMGAIGFTWANGGLQKVLDQLNREHPELLREVFASDYLELQNILHSTLELQMQWARGLSSHGGESIVEPWLGEFRSLGRRTEFQTLYYETVRSNYWVSARRWFDYFGFHSQRALAFMFDMAVHNSFSESKAVEATKTFATAEGGNDKLSEVGRLKILARFLAEHTNPNYYQDVLHRKMVIVNGGGQLHGTIYDLSKFGLALDDQVSFW